MTTRKNLRALTCEMLRLRLAQVHLSQVGKKEVLVERLFQHLLVSERAGEEDGSDSDSSTSTVDSGEAAHVDLRPEATPPSKTKHRRTHRPAPAGSAVGGIASAVVRKPTAGLPATTLRDSTSAGASVSKRSRRQPSRALRLNRPPSRPAAPPSPAIRRIPRQTATDATDDRRRRAKRHRRHLRSAHGHSYHQVLASPYISCVPTPDKRAIRKIKRVGQAAKKGTTRRQVSDLSSWMEAWNIFAATRIQTAPQTALELHREKSNIICQLFAAYSTTAALKYDKLFRQAVARDKLHTLCWDILKEDILVWCGHTPALSCSTTASSKQAHKHTALSTSTTPAGGFHHPERATHNAGQEICRRFNLGRCNKGAECYFAHKCWVTGCGGDHSAKACPRAAPCSGPCRWKVESHTSPLSTMADGHSVNDHINKEDFPVHYSSVDDAVALLSHTSCRTGCTWGSAGEDSFMWTHAFLLVYVQPLPSLTTTLRHSTGSWPTTMGAQLLHYLDDFLLGGPPGKDTCQEAMSRMLTVSN
eukprot:Em0288g2a